MFTTPGSPQVLPYISVEETLDSSPPELTSEPDIDQNDGNAPLQASLIKSASSDRTCMSKPAERRRRC
jgi:hypothetical protein